MESQAGGNTQGPATEETKMTTTRDLALASLVSISGLDTDRIAAAAQHGCPAWIESKDSYCHRPAKVGLLCKRHDTVAQKRADDLVAREAARREIERASAVKSLPVWRAELADLEASIAKYEASQPQTMERAATGGNVHPSIRKKQARDFERGMRQWREHGWKYDKADGLRKRIARAEKVTA